jgi:biopolymer transport protein ExbD
MAGAQDPSDNPVAINVVPLVDIIFCLCVFFMCSFKFRQLEGKFEAWLPKTGHESDPDPDKLLEEIRVAVLWDAATSTVTRKFGRREVPDDAELERLIVDARDARRLRGVADAPLTIDADLLVPWSVVIRVVDLAKAAGVARIQFAMSAPPAPRRR